MRKIALFAVLVVGVMLIVSCASMTSGEVNDETFRRIYSRYSSDLILDGATQYTVRGGDTLVNISRSLYHDPYYYPVIMLASRDVVLDPDKIQPGMVLTIPDLQRNMANARSRAAIKGVIEDCARIEDDRGRSATAAGLRQHAQGL